MAVGSRSNEKGRSLPSGHPGRWLWLKPPPSAPDLAGWALVPLRGFLGFTFCFAGLQKLANPGFFDAHNPASIQAQMIGAARHSPIHALISPLSHDAALIGVVIALGELAVGVGALLGLLTRIAAVGGLLISLSLFLAVSFHTNPYYTGSDIVFVFAWVPLLVGGGGQLSLDALRANVVAARHSRPASVPVALPFSTVQAICGHYSAGRCGAQRNAACQPGGCPYLRRELLGAAGRRPDVVVDADRRRLVGALLAGAGWVAVIAAGLSATVGRLLHTSSSSTSALAGAGSAGIPGSAPPATSAPPAPTPSTSVAPSVTSTQTAAPKPAGTRIGPASRVPVRGAATFQDPASGDPAIVVQPHAGTFVAFDAVCPHAGCTVNYTPQNATFFCPCHGSQFNGNTGAVEVGPASQGLRKIAIAEGNDGQLYAR